MMQRIAIFPKTLHFPDVNRCLKRMSTASASVGHAVAAAKVDVQEMEPTKEEKRFIKMNKPHIRPLYLDAQATTPVDPRVLDAMLPYLTQQYGNPHSRNHFYGWESETAVEVAREQVANLIGADPKEIIFTSGATESNNMALKGVARFYGEKKNHIITTQTEHKCVLDSCRALEGEGYKVTYLPVKTNGIINLKDLEEAITPQTALVSVMSVNNEIGVRQPITEIGAICKAKKILFHTDAAQAIGKIPIDVRKENINLMSISGHKIYGPKGIGALFVGRKPRVRLQPIQSGGGQERGLRSGTVPAPLVVGLGAACTIAQREMEADRKWIDSLSDRLLKKLTAGLTHVIRNGDPEFTYPGCLNLSFAYVEGESLLMALKDIALSSGSACTSASLEPSYVLRAIGTDEDLAHSSISLSTEASQTATTAGTATIPAKPTRKAIVRRQFTKPQNRPVYFDFQATTPMDPRVLDAMMPYQICKFGNPHSTNHFLGWESDSALEDAREKVAKLINAKPDEIIFTSGATESNNLALKGVMRGYRASKSDKNELITVKTEHKCILESAKDLEKEGYKINIIGVQQTGLIDHKELEQLITPQTALVSVMTINNEIGTHQNIPEIGAICEKKNVIFHTDAAQALGKVPIDVRKHKIMLMSMSGHKIYGPKGIGALFISRDIPINLIPNVSGGGQEFGFRSGTAPTPLIVGFGAACEVASYEIEHDKRWISMLSNRFRSKLKEKLTHVHRNGSDEHSYPGCFNLSFEFIEGDALMMGMRDVCLSTGSACTSAMLQPSYVLMALGISKQRANSAIRFGIGRFTTVEEVDYVAEKCIANVKRLREMSPLWEMVQEGIDMKSIIWAQH